jgi:hypothetical protein
MKAREREREKEDRDSVSMYARKERLVMLAMPPVVYELPPTPRHKSITISSMSKLTFLRLLRIHFYSFLNIVDCRRHRSCNGVRHHRRTGASCCRSSWTGDRIVRLRQTKELFDAHSDELLVRL